jgi:formiminotetrahydrofolate cyclodeaminase
MRVAESAAYLYERIGQLEGITPASMSSDLRVGRLMAAAAVGGAIANVRVNLESIQDTEFSKKMETRAAALESRVSPNPPL